MLGMQAEKPSPRLNFFEYRVEIGRALLYIISFFACHNGLDVEGNWIRIWLGAAFRFRMIPLYGMVWCTAGYSVCMISDTQSMHLSCHAAVE